VDLASVNNIRATALEQLALEHRVRYLSRTRAGTRRTVRGAAIQIAADDTTQHAMASMKASL